MITQAYLKELFVYNPETGDFVRKVPRGNQKAGSIANRRDKDNYIKIGIDGRDYRAHRLAFLYMEGAIPELVDHVNSIPYDNRWDNLRTATPQQNNRNRKATSKSGYLGISWAKAQQKWIVQVEHQYGGLFNYGDLELAVKKANSMRSELQGDRALLETFDISKMPKIVDLNQTKEEL